MKKLILSALACIAIVISSCNQNSPAPSSSGGSGTTNSTNMTPLENSLVGTWYLKRTENRSNLFIGGLGDSTISYKNHYNYYNSILEFSATPSGAAGFYNGVMGLQDNTPPQQNIAWKEGPNNSITIGSNQSFFIIKFLSTDSMILDFGGAGSSGRYFFNKNTITPKMNPIELQLSGNPWQLITKNGQPPVYPTYKQFNTNWYTNSGYLSKDSLVVPTNSVVGLSPWEVLYPNRTIPILHNDNSSNGGWFKIINLTPNSLQLEGFIPTSNSVSTSTLIYSR